MKRLIYMSAFARDLSNKEIRELGEAADLENNKRGITGVLLCLDNTFFQILEGEDYAVDNLFEAIKQDDRHKDIVCLINEKRVRDRHFPGRYMHTINLNAHRDALVQPLKVLLTQLMQSHRIIGKYTQPAVMNTLVQGLNPLSMAPQRAQSVVLFVDVMGFSKISEHFPVETVVQFVNRYLEVVTDTITRAGGEVTKYMGDCVMAHFAADQADSALFAAVRIQECLAAIRSEAPSDAPESMLYAGIGIDLGEVIQGNIGSDVKMDYTLLGSVVNRAQSLEKLTRTQPVSLIFSKEIKEAAVQPWDFMHLGKHRVKGKEEPVDLYSLDSPLVYLRETAADEQPCSETVAVD